MTDLPIPSSNSTSGFKAWWRSIFSNQPRKIRLRRYVQIFLEWGIILVVGWLYANVMLLNLDPTQLQESGEHHESSTFPLLAEIGLTRYGEIPLWNPYILTGFPYIEDPLNHFWHLVSTVPVKIWGGINGMKISMLMAFIIAGWGQWLFAHVFGLRGFSRLWAALLFMLSGGLAFLSDLGWYELLLGVVWFPWCFAALWWALRRRDWTSMILTAFCITMVLTTGGGYYPFYLLVSLGVLTVVHLLWSRPSKRLGRLLRAICIAVISAGLLAVVFIPVIHGFPLINRWTGDDREQTFSQSIPYALIHYIVSDHSWVGAEILGLPSGWKWFYIGAIALGAALCLSPVALVIYRTRRVLLITVAVLATVILAWMANRYTPPWIYIYDLFPFLYTLRFPNRLLVVATSPLMVLAGLGWQSLYRRAQQWKLKKNPDSTLVSSVKARLIQPFRSLYHWLPHFALITIMTASVVDVFTVNQAFAFSGGHVDPALKTALTWLKEYDRSLYYVNLGGDGIYWKGGSVAYELEMPVINYDYGRHLVSMDRQYEPESPFLALPKYVFTLADVNFPLREQAHPVNDIEGYTIWYISEALPVAFSAPPGLLQRGVSLSRNMVSELEVSYDGPNRIIAEGQPTRPGDQLVVLVSDYPGWELSVDGKPAPVLPANDYLGAAMLPGNHTYIFTFRPPSYFWGLTISALTLLATLVLLLKESPLWPKRRRV